MTTITKLRGGLAGAIGSAFVPGSSRMLFVEWDTGYLSSLDISTTPATYSVLGTGYTNPEDVKVTADGTHAYVTQRSGSLLYVDLSNADASKATVVTSGMTAPQQMFLDEADNLAYVVEYAPSGRLLKIDLIARTQTVLLTGLTNAVGLTLSADRKTAYISEQMTGPGTGRVSSFDLSSSLRQTVAGGLTSPFMLTWADAAQTTLYVPERDPANRLTSIVVATATANVAVTGLAFRPSSVAVFGAGTLLVCSDQEIDEVALMPGFGVDGLLFPSIGFVPVAFITGGLANITDPAYFYQVQNAPFGGSLPIMVNHLKAAADGATYYRVMADGVPRTDVFHGEVMSSTGTLTPATIVPHPHGGQHGYYNVLSPAALETWIPSPPPGCYLDSTTLPTGLHDIVVELYDAAYNPVGSSPVVAIYVDNNPCRAAIAVAPDPNPTCGFIGYIPPGSADISITLTPTQPEGFATYSFILLKGAGNPPVESQSGQISAVVSPVKQPAATLLGSCTVAAFAADLYVFASATNGWWRQSQYDAEMLIAFALAPI